MDRGKSGGDTAATDYFKSKTTEPLTAAFRPIVQKTMDQNSVTRQYNQLLGQRFDGIGARAAP